MIIYRGAPITSIIAQVFNGGGGVHDVSKIIEYYFYNLILSRLSDYYKYLMNRSFHESPSEQYRCLFQVIKKCVQFLQTLIIGQ